MVTKRIWRILALGLCALLLCTAAMAASLVQPGIEQMQSNWPQVQLWLHLLDAQDQPLDLSALRPQDVSVAADGVPLQVTDVTPAAEQTTTIFYLLDVSTSVPQAALDRVTRTITDHWQTKPAQERIVVVTFGQEIRVVCDEGDTADAAAEKLAAVRADETATRLYDGVGKIADYVAALQQEAVGRGVIILVTDGVDYAAAGTTRDEVLAKLRAQNLTLCALGIDKGANAQALQQTGELARASGGWMTHAMTNGLEDAADALLLGLRRSVCITAQAQNNIIGNSTKRLSVEIVWQGQPLQLQSEITVTRWQPDTTPPTVTLTDFDAQTITLTFSERVTGADKADNYGLCARDETVTPEYVVWDEKALTAQLHFPQPFYNGEYTLTLQGITDESVEANTLAQDTLPLYQQNAKMPFSVWLGRHLAVAIGVPLAVFIIALAIVIAVLRRRRTIVHEIERVVQSGGAAGVQVQAQPTLPLTLVVAADGQPPQRLQVHLTQQKAFVIGRSSTTCDLGLEDAQMSRRHFSLQWIQQAGADSVLVEDMGSTNGTQLNGIRLSAARMLRDGDVITAGNTRVIVYI